MGTVWHDQRGEGRIDRGKYPSAMVSLTGQCQTLDKRQQSQMLKPAKANAKEIQMEKPKVSIAYCTQCNWLLRSAWMAQELLQTFATDLGEVALLPGTGGVFEIRVNGELIWERKRDGGFPGPKELKQRIRDVIDPDRDLGHVDRANNNEGLDT